MKYLNSTLKQYFEDLSSNLPAPGGGSASALVLTSGVACLLMVINFTLGKKGYEEYQSELQKIKHELEQWKVQIEQWIDLDVEIYTKICNTYKLPKDTEEQKQQRDIQIQQALKESCDLLSELIEIGYNVLKHCQRLIEIGNKNLITDTGCGAIFLYSGIVGIKLNILINLKNVKDINFKNFMLSKIEKIITEIETMVKNILSRVETKL